MRLPTVAIDYLLANEIVLTIEINNALRTRRSCVCSHRKKQNHGRRCSYGKNARHLSHAKKIKDFHCSRPVGMIATIKVLLLALHDSSET